MATDTADRLVAKALDLTRQQTSEQLVVAHMTAGERMKVCTVRDRMDLARSRGWMETVLEERGDLDLLAAAEGVCATCWTALDDDLVCRECVAEAVVGLLRLMAGAA